MDLMSVKPWVEPALAISIPVWWVAESMLQRQLAHWKLSVPKVSHTPSTAKSGAERVLFLEQRSYDFLWTCKIHGVVTSIGSDTLISVANTHFGIQRIQDFVTL